MSSSFTLQAKLLTSAFKWTANSAAQIAIRFANFNAICTAPFAAIDAGVIFEGVEHCL